MSDVDIKTKSLDGREVLGQLVQAPCVIEIRTKSRYFKFEIRESGSFKNVVKTTVGKKKKRRFP